MALGIVHEWCETYQPTQEIVDNLVLHVNDLMKSDKVSAVGKANLMSAVDYIMGGANMTTPNCLEIAEHASNFSMQCPAAF